MPSHKKAEAAILASSGLAKNLVHGNPDVLRCINDIVAAVRELPRFQVLRAQAEDHVAYLEEHFAVANSAWALELCTGSLFDNGEARVHLHVYLHKDQGGHMRSSSNFHWLFNSTAP